mmetsp:Transcript_34028/g.101526  ORF Transcript_34028/g.101526 Transcript_34028/m.101526 type:complete len:249 (-) Transcript_34028:31-777(-)
MRVYFLPPPLGTCHWRPCKLRRRWAHRRTHHCDHDAPPQVSRGEASTQDNKCSCPGNEYRQRDPFEVGLVDLEGHRNHVTTRSALQLPQERLAKGRPHAHREDVHPARAGRLLACGHEDRALLADNHDAGRSGLLRPQRLSQVAAATVPDQDHQGDTAIRWQVVLGAAIRVSRGRPCMERARRHGQRREGSGAPQVAPAQVLRRPDRRLYEGRRPPVASCARAAKQAPPAARKEPQRDPRVRHLSAGA